jgi:CheY-like chemotaxis protein
MTASNPPSRPLKVLIVEDNNDARTTLRLQLGYGHVLYQVPDGLRALQIAGGTA